MRIDPSRDGHVAMSEQRGNPLDPHTRLHEPASKGASQVVRVQIDQIGFSRASRKSFFDACNPSAVLATKAKDGFKNEVRVLLNKYGAESLSALATEHYAVVLEEAGGIGHD